MENYLGGRHESWHSEIRFRLRKNLAADCEMINCINNSSLPIDLGRRVENFTPERLLGGSPECFDFQMCFRTASNDEAHFLKNPTHNSSRSICHPIVPVACTQFFINYQQNSREFVDEVGTRWRSWFEFRWMNLNFDSSRRGERPTIMNGFVTVSRKERNFPSTVRDFCCTLQVNWLHNCSTRRSTHHFWRCFSHYKFFTVFHQKTSKPQWFAVLSTIDSRYLKLSL